MRKVSVILVVLMVLAGWVLLSWAQSARWYCRPLWQNGTGAAYVQGVSCRVWVDDRR